MAEDVSFLQEIDDSLRAERIEQFWQRNSLRIALLCVAILLATGATVAWRNHLRSEQIRQTSVILHADSLAQDGKYEEAAAAYARGQEGAAGLGTLAKLRQAQALLNGGHKDTSLALFLQVAGDAHADMALRDLAALQAGILNPAGSQPLLAQAAQNGHPYANIAKQMQATTLMSTAKTVQERQQALTLLKALTEDQEQPRTQLDRAEELQNMLDGTQP